MKLLYSLLLTGTLLIPFGTSIHASSHSDSIHRNLVSFSPEIRTTDSVQSCQGLRLSVTRVITAPACAAKMRETLEQVEAIEVMDAGQQSIGQVINLNTEAIEQGHLTLSAWSAPAQKGESYPSMNNQPLPADATLTAHYLFSHESGLSIADKSVRNLQRSQVNSQDVYQIASSEPLPIGTPVDVDGQLVCVMNDNESCLGVIQNQLQPHERAKRSIQVRQSGLNLAQGCSGPGQTDTTGAFGTWGCSDCQACGCSGSGACELAGSILTNGTVSLACTCNDSGSCTNAEGSPPTTGCLPSGSQATVVTASAFLLTLLAALFMY